MYYKEHAPPHFHAEYGDFEVTIEIESRIVSGRFPRRRFNLVLEWSMLHKEELLANWDLATKGYRSTKLTHWSKSMIPHVVEAKHISAYKVWLKFNDGLSGEIDLYSELDGPIFEPLKNISYFSRFSVRYNTISWDNGADFAPEFLWRKIAQQQAPADWQKSARR